MVKPGKISDLLHCHKITRFIVARNHDLRTINSWHRTVSHLTDARLAVSSEEQPYRLRGKVAEIYEISGIPMYVCIILLCFQYYVFS